MKRILLLAALLVAFAIPASAQVTVSTARTACENCPFGGDYLQAMGIEARFLSLPLNPANGRNEGTGQMIRPFEAPAQFSVLIVGGVLADVTATGTTPGGQPFTLSTLSIVPSGPWYDVKLQIVAVQGRHGFTKFRTLGEGPMPASWGSVKHEFYR